MSVGLLRLACDESFDPLSDLDNVVWFLQTLRMSLPRFGKLPAKEVDDVESEVGSRILRGIGVAGPGHCGLLRLIPLTLQQRRFTLRLIVGHRGRLVGSSGEGIFDVRRGGLDAIPE